MQSAFNYYGSDLLKIDRPINHWIDYCSFHSEIVPLPH